MPRLLVTVPAGDLRVGDRLILPTSDAPTSMAHHFHEQYRHEFKVSGIRRVRPGKIEVTCTSGHVLLLDRQVRLERLVK